MPGFNPDWKNRDPGCKFPPKVQPSHLSAQFHKTNPAHYGRPM